MDEIGDYLVGLLMTVLGLAGLYLASKAHDQEMYVFGLGLGLLSVLFIFGLIRRHYDEAAQTAAERGR